MSARRLIVVAVMLSGCGAAGAPAARSGNDVDANGARVAGRGTADDPLQLCHMNGGLGRTDYAYVASYRCSDGAIPLGRDPERGARARRGNVGEGPDGHVVDLYDIPCSSGPVELYVDAYHCGPGIDTEIDPENLTRRQLEGFAATIRAMHDAPSDPRALELRREILMWVTQTRQITVSVCEGVMGLLPADAGRPYGGELILSLAAAVIEDGRDPADPVAVTLRGLQGMLLYYAAVVREEGDGGRVPALESLLAMAREQTLEPRVREIVSGCDLSGMGVHHVR